MPALRPFALALLAAPLALVAAAAASHAEDLAAAPGPPSAACRLVPDVYAEPKHPFQWRLGDAKGQDVALDLRRAAPLDGSPEQSLEIPARADTPAVPIVLDGQTPWRLALSLHAAWVPDHDVPEPSDVRFTVNTVFTLGGEPVGYEAHTLVAERGAIDQTQSPGELLADEAPHHDLTFMISPAKAPAGVPRTLDQVGTTVALQALAPNRLGSTGTLKVTLHLGAPPRAEGLGTELWIPGACGDGPVEPQLRGAASTASKTGPNAAADGCALAEAKPCAAPDKAALCRAHSDRCPAKPAAPEAAGEPETAHAPAPASPGWAPAVVTATVGVAGLACFRPRLGP